MTKRKPTSLRVVEGNRGSPLPKNKPKVSLIAPYCAGISQRRGASRVGPRGRHAYRAGLLTEIDRSPLAAYCQSYGRWVQAERDLERMAAADGVNDGRTATTTNGNVMATMLGIARRAHADMLRAAKEFELTPAAREAVV